MKRYLKPFLHAMQGAHLSLFNPHALVVIAISCTSVALTSSAMLDIGLDTYLKAFTLGAIWPVVVGGKFKMRFEPSPTERR